MEDPEPIFSLTVLEEPVAKERARTVYNPNLVRKDGTRGGIMSYTPDKTATAELLLKARAEERMNLDGLETVRSSGERWGWTPLEVCIRVYLPVPESWPAARKVAALAHELRPTSKPDGDNYLKLACDALNETVWGDDGQIVHKSVDKWYDSVPRWEIEVYRA